jgi:predicted  nucleic acid-binding Zn-ribbon protein
VEKEGELTEASIRSVIFRGKPYGLTNELEKLRLQLPQNPEGVDETALRTKRKEEALAFINRKLGIISWEEEKCELRENTDEQSHQAADVLPSANTLEKLLKYESALQKKLYRAMNHFERLQRRRKGENVPAPVAMEISTGA